jgi:hypothetical protein
MRLSARLCMRLRPTRGLIGNTNPYGGLLARPAGNGTFSHIGTRGATCPECQGPAGTDASYGGKEAPRTAEFTRPPNGLELSRLASPGLV